MIDPLSYDTFKKRFINIFSPTRRSCLNWIFQMRDIIKSNKGGDINYILNRSGEIGTQARSQLAYTPWAPGLCTNTGQHGLILTNYFFKILNIIMTSLLAPEELVTELRNEQWLPSDEIGTRITTISSRLKSRPPQPTPSAPGKGQLSATTKVNQTPPPKSSRQRWCGHHRVNTHNTRVCQALKYPQGYYCDYCGSNNHNTDNCQYPPHSYSWSPNAHPQYTPVGRGAKPRPYRGGRSSHTHATQIRGNFRGRASPHSLT